MTKGFSIYAVGFDDPLPRPKLYFDTFEDAVAAAKKSGRECCYIHDEKNNKVVATWSASGLYVPEPEMSLTKWFFHEPPNRRASPAVKVAAYVATGIALAPVLPAVAALMALAPPWWFIWQGGKAWHNRVYGGTKNEWR